MSYGARSPCLAFLYLLFLGSEKTMNPISSPKLYLHMCTLYLHTILWTLGTLSSPSVDIVTYLQHQGCWMSAGLLGSKEDVVFSVQLHSKKKTELISKRRITNYFNYYKYGYFSQAIYEIFKNILVFKLLFLSFLFFATQLTGY